jgi:phosphatidylethanolamine/phosphatidyl-N-methylethanolamine N-methyltransferase
MIVQSIASRPGDSILEVGVGTGLSLPLYPKGVKVTGIDLSQEMLGKAMQRVEEQDLSQVEAVLEMDAENMSFADNSFDTVVAMYIVSVSPNPVQLTSEMRRVCKPGGDIIIVNHFRSRNPINRALVNLLYLLLPLPKLTGFRIDLDLEEFIKATRLEVVEVRNANLFGLWKMLHCRNS